MAGAAVAEPVAVAGSKLCTARYRGRLPAESIAIQYMNMHRSTHGWMYFKSLITCVGGGGDGDGGGGGGGSGRRLSRMPPLSRHVETGRYLPLLCKSNLDTCTRCIGSTLTTIMCES